MHTLRRLDRAYRNSEIVYFNNSTKMVFFSDTHRGDGSVSDEFAENWQLYLAALRYYHKNGHLLFEVGDSDDLWEWPKFRHIVRGHKPIFKQLRKFHEEGRYYRIFGNHDMQLSDPEYVKANMTETRSMTGEKLDLFPGIKVHEGVRIYDLDSDREIFVVHGHHGDFINDQGWRYSMFTYRLIWRFLHRVGIKSPTSPTRNSYQRHKVERNAVRWIRKNGVGMICGHTHRVRFPNGGDAPYFNCGAGIFRGYVTGIEIEHGQISLVRWQILPNDEGNLVVVRSVMAGPANIADFPNTHDPDWKNRPSKQLG